MRFITPINILIIVLILAGLPIFVRTVSELYVVHEVADAPKSHVVLILGASVVQGHLSPTLEARTIGAIKLFQARKAKKILVSGDGRGPDYDEVGPVRDYLVAAGIPAQDIFLDRRGLDTYSSLYRASYVYGSRSLIVPTQDYHEPRVIMLGKIMGMKVTVLPVEGDSLWGYFREIGATWKAVLDVIRGREPMYLGAPVPLVGDGSTATR